MIENGKKESGSESGSETGNEQERVESKGLTIQLSQFLKTCGVSTGGQAKQLIQGGEILVNNVIETRRRRQLVIGDEVTLGDEVFIVSLAED